jgi:hypothetical protein
MLDAVEEVSARTGASGDMTIHRRLTTSSMLISRGSGVRHGA